MTNREKLRENKKELLEMLEVREHLQNAMDAVHELNQQYLRLTHERGVSRAARNAEEYLNLEAQRIDSRIKSLREIIKLRERELGKQGHSDDRLKNVWDIF